MKVDLKDVMHTEKLVLESLSQAWNLFNALETQHPDELNDFKEGIHKCQAVIGLRFAREYRPDVFPKKVEEKKECEEHFFNNVEFKERCGIMWVHEKCVYCGFEKTSVSPYHRERVVRFE